MNSDHPGAHQLPFSSSLSPAASLLSSWQPTLAEHLHYSREDTAWAFKEPTFQKSRDEDIDNTGQCAEPCNSYGKKVRLDPHRVTERTFAGLKSALCFKWVANKGLLCIAGNSAQRNVSAWMGGELGEQMHVCVWPSPSTARLEFHSGADQLCPHANFFLI